MCPLCNKPVPTPRGQEPDFIVSQHIDNDCQFTEGKKVISTTKKPLITSYFKQLNSNRKLNYCFY